MDVVTRVVKNTISLSLVRITTPLVSFLLVMLIARYRDVSFMGNYSLIQAFSFIFLMISSLGLEILIMRDVSKEEMLAQKYITNSFIILLFSGIIFALMMSLTANVFGYDRDVRIAMYVASFALIPTSLIAVCQGTIKAFERNVYITFISVIESIFRVGLSIVILHMGFGLSALMVISLISSFLGLFLAFYIIKKKIIAKIRLEIDLHWCKRILKSTLTFAIIAIVVSLYWRIGIIILSKIEGPSSVGIFSAGFKLFTLLQGFIVAFGISVFPNISRWYKTETDKFETYSVNSARYIVIVVIFMAVVITFLSGDIIRLLYGMKFKESAAVLKVLVWASVPFSMVTVFAYSLFSSYKQKIDLAINSIGLVSNFILNILLVPRFSYLGTSIAILLSTCILVICQYIYINQRLFKLRLRRILAPPVLSSAIMVSLVMILRSKINLYLLLACTSFLYFLTLYHFWGFEEPEKAYLKNLVGNFQQFWISPIFPK